MRKYLSYKFLWVRNCLMFFVTNTLHIFRIAAYVYLYHRLISCLTPPDKLVPCESCWQHIHQAIPVKLYLPVHLFLSIDTFCKIVCSRNGPRSLRNSKPSFFWLIGPKSWSAYHLKFLIAFFFLSFTVVFWAELHDLLFLFGRKMLSMSMLMQLNQCRHDCITDIW